MICVGYQLMNAERENPKLPFFPYRGVLNLFEEATGAIAQIHLTVPSALGLQILTRRCEVCLEPTEEEWCGRCQRLRLLDEEVLRVRKSCNYRENSSPLIVHGGCSPDNYPCMMRRNAEVCHQNYLVYIGRYNDLFKVGITRSSRGKSRRVLEQGLNEAVILGPFQGLPAALEVEESISRVLEIPQRLTRGEKIRSFASPASDMRERWDEYMTRLEDVLNTSRLGVDHAVLLPDFRSGQVSEVEIATGTVLEGNVVWIQGSTILYVDGEGFRGFDARDVSYREVGGVQL